MNKVKTAWIFDIDGVITNPIEKKVKNLEILDHIVAKLKKNEPVIFNTGRSLSWVIERVLAPLLRRVKNKILLENLFVVGEKGGTWLTFRRNGEFEQHKDDSISVPPSLQQKIKELVKQKYPQSMFYDETKQTMISVEMHDNYDLEMYKKVQAILKKVLKEILRHFDATNVLKLDPTIIAIDIENKHVSKGFALERILNWLKQNKIRPKKFIAIGDSLGDVKMAEKLHEENLPFEFVYVGNKDELKDLNFNFPITYTRKRFDKGTLGYLKSI